MGAFFCALLLALLVWLPSAKVASSPQSVQAELSVSPAVAACHDPLCDKARLPHRCMALVRHLMVTGAETTTQKCAPRGFTTLRVRFAADITLPKATGAPPAIALWRGAPYWAMFSLTQQMLS